MTFDFLASQPHWADHMRPIWEALRPEERGTFGRIIQGRVIVAAASADFKRASARAVRRPVIFFEHGAGFSFHGDGQRHASYAGGPGREQAAALPAVNRWVAERNAQFYPDIPGPIVGAPKMDALSRMPRPSGAVVAISFHWDCRVAQETRWALPHYQKVLPVLAKRYEGRLIGHGHPHSFDVIAKAFRRAGIPTVSRFEEVLARASVYVNDGSSTLYEFAATGRPVVVLNAPWYRRDVQHGLRFWDHADVGVQVDSPGALIDAIEEAFRDPPEQRARREAAVAEVYPYMGSSADRAVEVLRRFGKG